ncbi:unnamed protein product [Toxocara canis]|uniref:ShKT domain-containing protein n=1 Tax=Toxocara canis TaxID=6265 RepID=A0A183UFN7_TOXCA|nr:unnamed protein product [Toxocara canis]
MFAVFVLLAVVALANANFPAQYSVINMCNKEVNGVQRPESLDCTDAYPAPACASAFKLSPEIQQQNNDPTKDYKVNSNCYGMMSQLLPMCRKSCAVCCKSQAELMQKYFG